MRFQINVQTKSMLRQMSKSTWAA
uniref:Uncharacterized protein n=1 Tax=Arundo donax TaxID=35708 RepID=A0A0A9B6C2_ARUDO